MTYAGPSRADLESVVEGGEGYRRTGFGARRCPIPARLSPPRCILPAQGELAWFPESGIGGSIPPVTTQSVSGAARQPSRSARLMLFLLTGFVRPPIRRSACAGMRTGSP